MAARHGLPLRGEMSTTKSALFPGPRLCAGWFRGLPAAKYGKNDAESRNNLHNAGFENDGRLLDLPKDGADPEEKWNSRTLHLLWPNSSITTSPSTR